MNKLEICFKLLGDYNQLLLRLLEQNQLKDEDKKEIYEALKVDDNKIILSLNKSYETGISFKEFCLENNLSEQLPDIMQFYGSLYRHQENAIQSIMKGKSTIISTGTGSGKTESFLIPILDYCIKNRNSKGVKAIIIYPMNSLATDQYRRIKECTEKVQVTCHVLNGDTPWEKDEKSLEVTRDEIIRIQPDILITNYIMLERMLTSTRYEKLFHSTDKIFKYLVLDEIHTYNGNKGLNIKYLLHRVRHKFNTSIVQIGCSATLARPKEEEQNSEGDSTGSEAVHFFIQQMFNLKENDYNYIEPIFVSLKKLKYDVKDKVYKSISKSPIVNIIQQSLYNKSYSFKELLQLINKQGFYINEKQLKNLLKCIINLNNQYEHAPILDFRVHIFLRRIGDKVRRCMKCNRYYTSPVSRCYHCGHLVFSVYSKDSHLLIGNRHGGLYHTKDIFENKEYKYDLLSFNKLYDLERNSLKFRNYEIVEQGLRLLNIEYNKRSNKVYQVLRGKEELHRDDVINLLSPIEGDFDYFMLSRNLRYLNQKDKKALLFKDNREICGRYSNIFTDLAYSEFFEEVVKYISKGQSISISTIRKKCINALREYANKNSKFHEEAIQEFDYWFRRYIRKDEGKHVNKSFEKNLSKEENNLLNVALKEAVYFEDDIKEDSKFIIIWRADFLYSKGLKIDESKCSKGYISLSEKGRKYFDEAKDITNIEAIVKKLLKLGYLVRGKEKESANLYYLNQEKIMLQTSSSQYESLEEIEKQTLFISRPHTSEVTKQERQEYEKEFQEGKIQTLIATPTLEMGIDIGKLSTVYMIGVPPNPSNYCQRAGRAGRSREKFAMILTICSDRSSHDGYYYQFPTEMIEGTIIPPVFDIYNKLVLNKHINTYFYDIYKINKGIIERDKKLQLEAYYQKLFNLSFEINLEDNIRMIRETKINSIDLYQSGLYPDYCFCIDEIEIHDENNNVIEDTIRGTRELDIAYMTLDIEWFSMFIGSKYYTLVPKTKKYFYFQREIVKNIMKLKGIEDKEKIRKERLGHRKFFINIKDNRLKDRNCNSDPIFIETLQDTTLQYIQVVTIGQDKYYYGYELKTNIILFKFSNKIISNVHVVSLLSIIYKMIIRQFGLDTQELGLNIDNMTINEELDNDYLYGIIYDKNSNKNIDMNNIELEIKNKDSKFLEVAYYTLQKCNCDDILGCYSCLKSFNTQYLYHFINKKVAKNCINFLRGKERLKPEVPKYKNFIDYYEATITIKKSGTDFYLIINGKEEKLENKENENETVMAGLYPHLKQMYEEGITTLEITSHIDRFINGLNEETKLNNTPSLEKCLFYKQAFERLSIKKS